MEKDYLANKPSVSNQDGSLKLFNTRKPLINTTSPSVVRIATWNAKYFPYGSAALAADKYCGRFTSGFSINSINNYVKAKIDMFAEIMGENRKTDTNNISDKLSSPPEILCMQEVTSLSAIDELAIRLNYSYIAIVDYSSSIKDDKSLLLADYISTRGANINKSNKIYQSMVILSKYKIEKSWLINFEKLTDKTKPPRGIIGCIININGKQIVVYNCHLKSNLGNSNNNIEQRELAVHYLEADISRLRKENINIPIVILGDFNTVYKDARKDTNNKNMFKIGGDIYEATLNMISDRMYFSRLNKEEDYKSYFSVETDYENSNNIEVYPNMGIDHIFYDNSFKTLTKDAAKMTLWPSIGYTYDIKSYIIRSEILNDPIDGAMLKAYIVSKNPSDDPVKDSTIKKSVTLDIVLDQMKDDKIIYDKKEIDRFSDHKMVVMTVTI